MKVIDPQGNLTDVEDVVHPKTNLIADVQKNDLALEKEASSMEEREEEETGSEPPPDFDSSFLINAAYKTLNDLVGKKGKRKAKNFLESITNDPDARITPVGIIFYDKKYIGHLWAVLAHSYFQGSAISELLDLKNYEYFLRKSRINMHSI